ncbi:MAG TPA: PspA/IM30 family protein [Blastocatellia bacterium]|nr:PspA/IM30 family protein [Blastocatellia bacterium]
MKRAVRSRVDSLVDGNEDINPEKLYRLKVEELDRRLTKSRHAVMEAQQHVRSLEESLVKADVDIAEADARIREAVSKGDDALARERIHHLQNYKLRRDGIANQLEQSRQMLADAQEVHEQAKLLIERKKIEAEVEYGVFRK